MLSQGHFFFIISIFCSFQNKLNYNVEDVCPKYTPVILFHSLVQDMIVSADIVRIAFLETLEFERKIGMS